MSKQHQYVISTEWTGNQGQGTLNYKAYNRNHRIEGKGKYAPLQCSSDPAFLGDASRYNPEDLFVSSISACHMLWYLHLCAINKIVVTNYVDHATGIMEEKEDGSGRFVEVTLHPKVTITNADLTQKAIDLHHKAHQMCFIANSCNFKIGHQPEIRQHPIIN